MTAASVLKLSLMSKDDT